MAFFAIAPLLCALVQNEIQMTLYMHISWSPATNDVKVVEGSYNRFGEIRVNNWNLLDGPDPSSADVIGHVQGLNVKTTQTPVLSWHSSVDFVFTEERFNGSTLQVIGAIPRHREWSIVGGTGKLTMARGIAMYDVVKNNTDLRIYKINIQAYYTLMDSTAVSGKSGCNSKISEPIAVN